MSFKREAKIYDRFYSAKDYAREVSFLMQFLKGKSVIDFGCGTGNHSVLLEKKGFNVIGVEPCKEMAKQAEKKLINLRTLETIHNGWENIIMMFDVLNFLNKPEKYIEKLKNKLVSGGRIIVETWRAELSIKKFQIKYVNGILRLAYKRKKRNKVVVYFLYLPYFIFSKHELHLYFKDEILKMFKDFKLIYRKLDKSIIWVFEKK